MEAILIPILLAAIMAGVYFYSRKRRKSTSPAGSVDYAGIVTTEGRRRVIRQVESPAELEKALNAWVDSGLSPDGLLYAEGLERKEQLTGSLSDAEAMRVSRAKRARTEGAKMPPIKGRGRM